MKDKRKRADGKKARGRQDQETWWKTFMSELKAEHPCIRDENTFYVNGEEKKFAKNALHLLPNRNPFRILLVKFT